MKGRKGGLPGPTELFTLRFQTVWMRDKASTLLGTAKNIRFQNTEYIFLLLFSINGSVGVVLSSLLLQNVGKKGSAGEENMIAPFSLSPAMMLSLFPQNRVQGDTASLLLSAHQQDCAQE